LEAGQNNVIKANKVSRTLLDGIRISAFDPDQPTRGNVVQGNRVHHAMADGISVATSGDGPVDATTLTVNIISGSGADGIDISSPATTVSRNLAVRNALRHRSRGWRARRRRNTAFGNRGTDERINIYCRPATKG
jgi:hypothetical protein